MKLIEFSNPFKTLSAAYDWARKQTQCAKHGSELYIKPDGKGGVYRVYRSECQHDHDTIVQIDNGAIGLTWHERKDGISMICYAEAAKLTHTKNKAFLSLLDAKRQISGDLNPGVYAHKTAHFTILLRWDGRLWTHPHNGKKYLCQVKSPIYCGRQI